ncbi:hypothetical protein PIECOFPK_02232 [Mycovorax composti]|jgi:Protein of unknown function (DUF1469).|uniref:Phage holin family protein n=2 Tax=Chitinophagaceae TaxID=563835 RepID=A0ABZ2EM25_9BACT
MFEIKDKVEDIASNVEEIAKTYYRLSVIRIADKGSSLAASLLITFFVAALLFFAMFFVCMGVSWWIGQKLGNPTLGFFIVAGGLFVLLLLVLLLTKKLLHPFIRNVIIKAIYG